MFQETIRENLWKLLGFFKIPWSKKSKIQSTIREGSGLRCQNLTLEPCRSTNEVGKICKNPGCVFFIPGRRFGTKVSFVNIGLY